MWTKPAALSVRGCRCRNTELMLHGPIMPLLGEFSRQTQAVINIFDY